jgi:hypothetical protein
VLAAVTLLLASLLQAVVSKGVAETAPAAQAIDDRSPATAALTDGDDRLMRFFEPFRPRRVDHP